MVDGYVLDRTEYSPPAGVSGSPLQDDPDAVRSALRESVAAAIGRTRDLIEQAAAELLVERAH